MWHFINGISVVLLSNYSCFLINIYDAIKLFNTVTFIRLIELKNTRVYTLLGIIGYYYELNLSIIGTFHGSGS